MPILDDGHTLDRALAFHPDAVHLLAAAGAAQLAQAVEVGQGGHCAPIPSNRPTEEGDALQVSVSQGVAQIELKKKNLTSTRHQKRQGTRQEPKEEEKEVEEARD